jgi:hypothetical protein
MLQLLAANSARVSTRSETAIPVYGKANYYLLIKMV